MPTRNILAVLVSALVSASAKVEFAGRSTSSWLYVCVCMGDLQVEISGMRAVEFC
jgi:hypothetical protein